MNTELSGRFPVLRNALGSEAGSSGSVDRVSVLHELADSLADLSLVRTQQVDFALDTELVARRDAWLRVLALTHQEGQLRVRTLNRRVVAANERPKRSRDRVDNRVRMLGSHCLPDSCAGGAGLAEDEAELLDSLLHDVLRRHCSMNTPTNN